MGTWRRVLVVGVAMSGMLALGACTSDGDGGDARRDVATTATSTTAAAEPATPGWDGYVDPAYEPFLPSATWDGERMVLAAFDEQVEGFGNIVAAYDPQIGRWEELEPLPTHLPVTVGAVVRTSAGAVFAGETCDPATAEETDEGLYCMDGEVRTYVLPAGADAFEEIEAPVRMTEGYPYVRLVEGSPDDAPLLVMEERTFRLEGREWVPLTWEQDATPSCIVDGELVGYLRFDVDGDIRGRLARFDEATQRWERIRTGPPARSGRLTCSDGGPAWFEITDAPDGDETYLIARGAEPVRVQVPDDVISSWTPFTGASFAAWVTPYESGDLPGDRISSVYVLDEETATLVPSDVVASEEREDIRVHPLDGEVALFLIQRWEDSRPTDTTYEVRDVPKPVG